MAGQSWLAYTFAGVMLVTAAYCFSRLVVSWRQHRPTDYRVDAVHVLMGIAMAGMLVPRLRVFWAGGWEVVFAVATVWFAWLAVSGRRREVRGSRSGHHFQHVLACGAMLYMFLAAASAKAAAGGSGMSGMGGAARFPTLALVFAFGLFGYVVWTADRLPGLARVAAAAPARSLPASALAGATASLSTAGQAAMSDPDPGGHAQSWRKVAAPLSPRLAACCEIAMGVTMGYMLILML